MQKFASKERDDGRVGRRSSATTQGAGGQRRTPPVGAGGGRHALLRRPPDPGADRAATRAIGVDGLADAGGGRARRHRRGARPPADPGRHRGANRPRPAVRPPRRAGAADGRRGAAGRAPGRRRAGRPLPERHSPRRRDAHDRLGHHALRNGARAAGDAPPGCPRRPEPRLARQPVAPDRQPPDHPHGRRAAARDARTTCPPR